MGVKRSADTGEEGPDNKGDDLVNGGVDAHGFGGNLILANGDTGPAVGGTYEVLDHNHRDDGKEEYPSPGGFGRDAA
ncbi:hypothetical protein D3C81_2097350 [compost metagenome]